MGRQNPEWYHEIKVGLSIQAPDEDEALKRLADTRDALQERFNGMEVYRPRGRGSTGPARIAGSPRFLDFILAPGQPSPVVAFSDELDEGVRRKSPAPETVTEDTQVLLVVANAIVRLVEKGLVPEDEELEGLAANLKRYIESQSVPQTET